jgi:hypothetical protein
MRHGLVFSAGLALAGANSNFVAKPDPKLITVLDSKNYPGTSISYKQVRSNLQHRR